MMRWLKDKKKDRRTSSSNQEDDGKEDDYGFGKEKLVVKSSSTKRELPPTPAAPEEKSPHIYEEIPDLAVDSATGGAKLLTSGLVGKLKYHNKTNAAGKSILHQDKTIEDDISPYMVVPVDKEVRQTPTDFHRNGTPEVHCDVIVKDTHCEILLTRKPKVGRFGKEGFASDAITNFRNNTHFCSQDRRASVDCLSAGKLSSAFSVASTAFPSPQDSKNNSFGRSSSVSLSNFQEHQQFPVHEANDSEESSTSGIVTYTAASNFIPRTSKLTFKPLPGRDPCTEVFGKDPEEESYCVEYSSTRNEDSDVGVNYSSLCVTVPNAERITPATTENHLETDLNSGCQVMLDTSQKQYCSSCSYKYNDEKAFGSQLKTSDMSGENFGFAQTSKTGVIRPSSPSNSSTCTYASVTFPMEPKHYSTIPELISAHFHNEDDNGSNEISGNATSVSCEMLNDHQSNNKNCDLDKSKITSYSEGSSFYPRVDCENNMISLETNNNVRLFGSGCTLHPPVLSQRSIDDNHVTYAGLNRDSDGSNSTSKVAGVSKNLIDLEFCSCSDSSCGCPDVKPHQDDDSASSNCGGYSGLSSCRGCGRLIRQITYSESYSDETYEHVYASRLLIRTGRRFSSPDITFSEASHSEFQEVPNLHSPDFLHSYSRDDTWASTKSVNIIPPSYNAVHNDRHVESRILRGTADNCEHNLNAPDSDDTFTSCLSELTSSGGLFHKHDYISNINRSNSTPANDVSGSTSFQNDNRANQGKSRDVNTQHMRHSAREIMKSDAQGGLPREHCVDKKLNFSYLAPDQSKNTICSGISSQSPKIKGLKQSKPETSVEGQDRMNQPMNIDVHDTKSRRDSRQVSEIPEKNTKRLSSFFQRLSTNDVGKSCEEKLVLCDRQYQSDFITPTDGVLSDPISDVISDNTLQQASVSHCQTDVGDKSIYPDKQELHLVFPCLGKQPLNSTSTLAKNQSKEIPISQAGASLPSETSIVKSPNKTDSGDTCYEYDISTSSEGEQTSYECFLSKVKNTLNLEHEAQHIAETSAARKKLICKRCRKGGVYRSNDDEEQSSKCPDGSCPHLTAKFGDLRALVEDLVVDQRAAILDCLTDYTSNPYNIISQSQGPESHCRECGCEILTSDSESVTTVYSLLSQQFRMTSPNGQTPSCDSDDGTMADNSCESADEDYIDRIYMKEKQDDEAVSSGYDEPANAEQDTESKTWKRKEKIERKGASSMEASNFAKNIDPTRKKLNSTLCLARGQHDCSSLRGSSQNDISKLSMKDSKYITSDGLRRNVSKKTRGMLKRTEHSTAREGVGSHSSRSEEKNDNNDSRDANVSKMKTSMITEKILKDIYAPLPPKALSLLTSRNHGNPTGVLCMCGKGRQPNMALMTASKIQDSFSREVSFKVNSVKSVMSDSLLSCIDQDKKLMQGSSKEGGGNFGASSEPAKTSRKSDDAWKCDIIKMESTTLEDSSTPQTLVKGNRNVKMEYVGKQEDRPPTQQDTAFTNSFELRNTENQVWFTTSQINSEDLQLQNSSFLTMHLKSDIDDTASKTSSAEKVAYEGSVHTKLACTEQTYAKLASVKDVKLDDSKSKYIRKQKLELATLDLLPETVLGRDDMCNDSCSKKDTSHSKQLKMVERMAKVYEDNVKRSKTKASEGGEIQPKTKYIDSESLACSGNSSMNISDNISSSVSVTVTNTSFTRAKQNSSSKIAGTYKMHYGQSSDCPQDLISNSPGKVISSITSPKTFKSKIISNGDGIKVTDTTDATAKVLISQNILTSNDTIIKSEKGELGGAVEKSQKSPTPSSSSTSSTSSVKKKGGVYKPRKLTKKTYHRKRSRSRTERRKSSNLGQEERTYYYFSSDFSDIDVVEIEDWESYAKSNISTSSKSLHTKKMQGRRKKSEAGQDGICNFPNNDTQSRFSNKSGEEDTDNQEQEIYSIPPSSSELRKPKESSGTGASPQLSPEIAKGRKAKRMDVYKTKKSNNKLLSDLIIRNYDMQIYGNV